MSQWTIFSNHGHVLVCLARDSDARLRDVAADVGITERAVQKIVRDLQHSGMISVSKQGRRNSYRIENKTKMRHSLEAHCGIGALMDLVGTGPDTRAVSVSANQVPEVLSPSRSTPDPEPIVAVQANIVEPVVITPAKPDPEPVVSRSDPSKTDPESAAERQQGSLF